MPDDDRDPLDRAARRLYAVAPEQFLTRRAELVDEARAAGDPATATALGKLRKPTVAAWIVNAHVAEEPSIPQRLGELGERLRAAQERLDAAALRELSSERRTLVTSLARAALAAAGKKTPPAALRDEVIGTFDAAVADADIAARLGRLQRSEQWSGFGFAPTASPTLTVVRGAQGSPATPAKKAAPKVSAAERRKIERELARVREEFTSAEADFDAAQLAERELTQQVKRLTRKLTKLQGELDDTRSALDAAREQVGASRRRRRDARTALDRAERSAGG